MRVNLFLISLFLSGIELNANALEGPCEAHRRERSQSRELLQKCISGWIAAENPNRSKPSSECLNELSHFMTKAKVLRSCREEQRQKREEKYRERLKKMGEEVPKEAD